MQVNETDLFLDFKRGLIDLPVSHLWTGYGSTLFLELGNLTPRILHNGKDGKPNGEMSIMIQWSWRIEGRKSIICGSWSDEHDWVRGLSLLRNKTITDVSLFGRLPEIDIAFSNGAHCLSFMTEKV